MINWSDLPSFWHHFSANTGFVWRRLLESEFPRPRWTEGSRPYSASSLKVYSSIPCETDNKWFRTRIKAMQGHSESGKNEKKKTYCAVRFCFCRILNVLSAPSIVGGKDLSFLSFWPSVLTWTGQIKPSSGRREPNMWSVCFTVCCLWPFRKPFLACCWKRAEADCDGTLCLKGAWLKVLGVDTDECSCLPWAASETA